MHKNRRKWVKERSGKGENGNENTKDRGEWERGGGWRNSFKKQKR